MIEFLAVIGGLTLFAGVLFFLAVAWSGSLEPPPEPDDGSDYDD